MGVDDTPGRVGPLRNSGRRFRRFFTRDISGFPRKAARIAGSLASSVLDFAIDDVCVLCHKPGFLCSTAGPGKFLAGAVRHRVLRGLLEITNHPVCAACAGRLPVALMAGELGYQAGPHTVVTQRGEVFAGDGSAVVRGRVAPSGPPIRVISPYMVDDNVLQIIHLVKFGRYEALARPVAEAILWAIGQFGPAPGDGAVIVPVPMDARGLKRRGFNQSERFAHRIAEVIDLPLDTVSLRKTAPTRPQSRTKTGKRADNVRGVFSCGANISGTSVLLVDDLVTTGATAAACAATLLAAGAGAVTVVCFGRAL